jgi:hypothetical protein
MYMQLIHKNSGVPVNAYRGNYRERQATSVEQRMGARHLAVLTP